MLPNKITVDADVLIWYLRGDHATAEHIEYYLSHDIPLAASVLVILEVLRGMRPHEAAVTETLLNSIEHMNVNDAIIAEAYTLFHKQRQHGKTVPFADSIIAATAIVAEAPLLTYNTKHYPAHCLVGNH